MQSIIISALSLLISMLAYTADAPVAPVSHAAEKAEAIIPDITLPQEIPFLIPTVGDEKTHILNIKEKEAIDLISFDEIMRENLQRGIPTLIGHLTYLNGEKTSYSAYKAQNLINTFSYQDGIRDPLTNCDVLRASFHLVDIQTCTTPATIKTMFLGDLSDKENEIDLLCDTLDQLNDQNKELNTIKSFMHAGRVYYDMYHKKGIPLYEHPIPLAAYFFKRVVETINNIPPDISCDHSRLKEYKMSCLRQSAHVFTILYRTDKKDEHAHLILKYYAAATSLGDRRAKEMAQYFIEEIADDSFIRKSGSPGKRYLKSLERLVEQSPTEKNRYLLANFYKKLGYHEIDHSKRQSTTQLNEPASKIRKLN